jgi:hypothetical protein
VSVGVLHVLCSPSYLLSPNHSILRHPAIVENAFQSTYSTGQRIRQMGNSDYQYISEAKIKRSM